MREIREYIPQSPVEIAICLSRLSKPNNFIVSNYLSLLLYKMVAKTITDIVVPDVPGCYLQKALTHPRTQDVIEEVDGYFLRHWPFPNAKARNKFVAAGFSRVTCLYFPKALDDRIHYACRLLTILFLVDGMISTRFYNPRCS